MFVCVASNSCYNFVRFIHSFVIVVVPFSYSLATAIPAFS